MTDSEMINTMHEGIDCFERVIHQLRFQPQRRTMEFKLNDIIRDAYWVIRTIGKEATGYDSPPPQVDPNERGYEDFKQVFGRSFGINS